MRRCFKKSMGDVAIIFVVGILISLFCVVFKERILQIFSFFGYVNYNSIALKVITVDSTFTSFSLVFIGFVMGSRTRIMSLEVKEVYYKYLPDTMIKIFPKLFKRTLFSRIVIMIFTTLLEIFFILINQEAVVLFLFLITVYELLEILYTSSKVSFFKKHEQLDLIQQLLVEEINKRKRKKSRFSQSDNIFVLKLISDIKVSGDFKSVYAEALYVYLLRLAVITDVEGIWDVVFNALDSIEDNNIRLDLIYSSISMSMFDEDIGEYDLEEPRVIKFFERFSFIIKEIKIPKEFTEVRDEIVNLLVDFGTSFIEDESKCLSDYTDLVKFVLKEFDDKITKSTTKLLKDLAKCKLPEFQSYLY